MSNSVTMDSAYQSNGSSAQINQVGQNVLEIKYRIHPLFIEMLFIRISWHRVIIIFFPVFWDLKRIWATKKIEYFMFKIILYAHAEKN
jgi:hypothetical protein